MARTERRWARIYATLVGYTGLVFTPWFLYRLALHAWRGTLPLWMLIWAAIVHLTALFLCLRLLRKSR